MNGNWRKWNLLGIALLIGASAADEELLEVSLAPAGNLQTQSREAEAACVPLLLMFSSDYCEYCELLEEEILHPMLRNREYDSRVSIRKLRMDSSQTLVDFTGDTIQPNELTSRYNVFVTPTVLLVDSKGNELTERLVGINTVEMYGGYLDSAIDIASQKLRQTDRCD